MTPFVLRPFEDRDYPRCVALSNQGYPADPLSEADMRHEDAIWDGDQFDRVRLVAETVERGVIGYGQIAHRPGRFHPQKYWLDLVVDPSCRRQGVGSLILDRMLAELRARDATLARAWIEGHFADSIDFLRHRGFREVQRAWEQRLPLEGFDLELFRDAEQRPAGQGITITTMQAELARDPEALRAIYELFTAVRVDQPSLDPLTPVGWDLWRTNHVEAPGILADGYFLARDGDRYVAQVNLWCSPDQSELLNHVFTGVLPSHRGRGLSLALKLQAIRYALQHGYREIRGTIHSQNRPMLRINHTLGFQTLTELIAFELPLG